MNTYKKQGEGEGVQTGGTDRAQSLTNQTALMPDSLVFPTFFLRALYAPTSAPFVLNPFPALLCVLCAPPSVPSVLSFFPALLCVLCAPASVRSVLSFFSRSSLRPLCSSLCALCVKFFFPLLLLRALCVKRFFFSPPPNQKKEGANRAPSPQSRKSSTYVRSE